MSSVTDCSSFCVIIVNYAMITSSDYRLTGLPGAKKAKGSEHYNVDEPYCIVHKVHVDQRDTVIISFLSMMCHQVQYALSEQYKVSSRALSN